jgi:hypothetical protein
LAGAIVVASLNEIGNAEHCHERTYETTPIVQTCVPFVTGSYIPIFHPVMPAVRATVWRM